MRQIVTAAAMAIGLVGIWAAVLPLTAQPAAKPGSVSSPPLSGALFLCRGPNGVDRTCAAALARALVIEQPGRTLVRAEGPACHAHGNTLSASAIRD
jgi:hypothetical protein